MKITSLQELIDRGQTQDATKPGVEYLVKNPYDFINLVKQDISLAQLYVDFFTLEDIEKIAQGNSRFFTWLYMLTCEPAVKEIAAIKRPLVVDENNLEACMREIRQHVRIQSFEQGYAAYYNSELLYKQPYMGSRHYITSINYVQCTLAYNEYAHAKLVKNKISEILSKIFSQLTSSNKKEDIVDAEFRENFMSSISSLFTSKYYLIDSMIDNKDYELLEKIIPCISKSTLQEQFEQSQKRMGALSAEVSQKFDELLALKETQTPTPSAPPIYEITPQQYLYALERIVELEQQVGELKIQLQTAQAKAANQPTTFNAYAKSTSSDFGSLYPKFT